MTLCERIRVGIWFLIYLLLKSNIPTLVLYREHNRFRHIKSQGVYILIMDAFLESSQEVMVLYQSIDTGKCWIRSKETFFDGRFEQLS